MGYVIAARITVRTIAPSPVGLRYRRTRAARYIARAKARIIREILRNPNPAIASGRTASRKTLSLAVKRLPDINRSDAPPAQNAAVAPTMRRPTDTATA